MKRLALLPALLYCGALMAQTPAAPRSSEPTAQEMIDRLSAPAPKQPDTAPPAAPSKSRGMSSSTRNLMPEKIEPSAGGGAHAPAVSAAPAAPAAPAAAPAAPAAPAHATLDLAIQFESGSDKIKRSSMLTLSNLATAMLSPQLARRHFRLEGHTDAAGQAAQNRKLSAARAEQVKRILVANQVAPERLSTEGKGSTELANPANPTAPENRRVRIVSVE